MSSIALPVTMTSEAGSPRMSAASTPTSKANVRNVMAVRRSSALNMRVASSSPAP